MYVKIFLLKNESDFSHHILFLKQSLLEFFLNKKKRLLISPFLLLFVN